MSVVRFQRNVRSREWQLHPLLPIFTPSTASSKNCNELEKPAADPVSCNYGSWSVQHCFALQHTVYWWTASPMSHPPTLILPHGSRDIVKLLHLTVLLITIYRLMLSSVLHEVAEKKNITLFPKQNKVRWKWATSGVYECIRCKHAVMMCS